MDKINFFLICVFWAAIQTINAAPIIVCGQISAYTKGAVSVKPLQDFLLFNDIGAEVMPDAKGKFRIEIDKKGPFLAELHFLGQYLQIYLQANDSIFCNFEANNFFKTLRFSGISGAENTLLIQMQNELEYSSEINLIPNKVRELNATEFMVAALQKKQIVDSFVKSHTKTGFYSADFLNYIQNEIEYGMALDLLSYPEMHDYFNTDSTTTLPANYYDFLNNIKIENPYALISYTYTNFLHEYLLYRYQSAHKKTVTSKYSCLHIYDWADQILIHPKLRDHARAALLIKATNNLELSIVKPKIDDFEARSSVPEYFRLVNQNFMRLRQITPGNPAPAFALKDMYGRIVSLSDFEGKVVYLDFWASWCKPCIQERQHLEALRKQIPSSKLVLLNISLDENHQTWLRSTKSKTKPGIDLIGYGTNSEIALKYNIDRLPTYILIDKNGKLVDVKAKRPSDKKLVAEIKALLEK